MTNRTFYIIIGCLAGITVLSVVFVLGIILRSSSLSPDEKVKSSPLAGSKSSAPVERSIVYSFFNQLDGRAVSSTENVVPLVVGLMIDNHPDARPQAGISQARVVYEMPVEGAFTRYLALFDSTDTVPRVGPVRSARPYFVDAIREYGLPWYFHSGGSPEALTLLKSGVVQDGNEFSLGKYFTRDSAKDAPHNLYSSSTAWNDLIKSISAVDKRSWQGWRFARYANDQEFQDLVPFAGVSSTEKNTTITIRYAANYIPTWNYDGSQKKYIRLLKNSPVNDEAGAPVTADTVIVQQAVVRSIDADDRKSIALVGSGKGFVVSRGLALKATWKKTSPTDRTRWYDEKDQELVLVPGTVWVEVVPLAVSVGLQ